MFDKIIFLYWLTYECCQTFECGAVVQLMLSSNMVIIGRFIEFLFIEYKCNID